MVKFPKAEVFSKTTADIAIKFMQRYISNDGVPRKLKRDQAQAFRYQTSRWMITHQ